MTGSTAIALRGRDAWARNTPALSVGMPSQYSSMVKRKSFLASNEEFRVRLLVELLQVTWFPWCSGCCTPGCEPGGMGSTPIGYPSRRMPKFECRMTNEWVDLHECAPGRAASLQNWSTGFESLRSC